MSTDPRIINAEHEVQRSVERLDRAIDDLNTQLSSSLATGREQLGHSVNELKDKSEEVRRLAVQFLNRPREEFERFVSEKVQQAESYVVTQGEQIERLAINRFELAKATLNTTFDETLDSVERAVGRVFSRISADLDREIERLDEKPLATWISCFVAGFAAALFVSGRISLRSRPSVPSLEHRPLSEGAPGEGRAA